MGYYPVHMEGSKPLDLPNLTILCTFNYYGTAFDSDAEQDS
jgi:hypothetical protein